MPIEKGTRSLFLILDVKAVKRVGIVKKTKVFKSHEPLHCLHFLHYLHVEYLEHVQLPVHVGRRHLRARHERLDHHHV
jgi:hypothetical protein